MLYRVAKKIGWITPQRRLELYPPFRAMGIKVLRMERDGRDVVIRLPLSRFNRNPGGGMFGGAMASLADPIPALMCARLFSGYSVWTRHLEIDFQREARSDLELRLVISDEQEREIRDELARRGRATPVFEYAYFDSGNQLCASMINRVALRPDGYKPSNGALRGVAMKKAASQGPEKQSNE